MHQFIIHKAGSDQPTLTSQERLTPDDFMAIAAELRQQSSRARKIGFVAARQASQAERVTTEWNGKETEKTAQPGDWIVANLNAAREILRDDAGAANIYVIGAEKFSTQYQPDEGENEFGAIYRAISEVEALHLPGGFEIMAPWGEIQRGARGYLILNGDDVYGNHQDTFEATYEFLD